MSAPIELFFDIDDARLVHAIEERGTYTFEHEGGLYVVRKRFEKGGYQVELFRKDERSFGSCSCPDFQFRGADIGNPCKHLWIVAEFLGLVQFPRDSHGHVYVPAEQTEEA